MNNWEVMKGRRKKGQAYTPAYRRVDRRVRCKQDEVFGRPQLCDCPSCMEAYRQRIFWRNPKNAGHFIPLNQITILDQERRSYPIKWSIQHPEKVEPRS
jgi:hypothetical protein